MAATVKRAQNPATGASGGTYVAAVTKVLTPNAGTAVFELSHPDNSLLYGLTSTNLAILSRTAITAGTVATKPDGTGPFRFSSWSPGNSFTVVRNAHYWGGNVTLPKVEIKTVPSDSSIGAALLARQRPARADLGADGRQRAAFYDDQAQGARPLVPGDSAAGP